MINALIILRLKYTIKTNLVSVHVWIRGLELINFFRFNLYHFELVDYQL